MACDLVVHCCTSQPGVSDDRPVESLDQLIFRVNSTMLKRVTQHAMAELGVTNQQGRILFVMASGGCLKAADLAREFGVQPSTVTRMIDRLEKRHLLTRARSAEDRRVVRFALTPKGQAVGARMPVIFNDVMEKLLSGSTPEEVHYLKHMLRRILAELHSVHWTQRVHTKRPVQVRRVSPSAGHKSAT